MLHSEGSGLGSGTDDFEAFIAQEYGDSLPSARYHQQEFGIIEPPADMPLFGQDLTPQVYFAQTEVKGKEQANQARVSIRLSDIRPLLYLQLWKEKRANSPLPPVYDFDVSQSAIARGVLLHEIDGIFRTMTLGNIGVGVAETFPSLKKPALVAYQEATRYSRLYPGLRGEDLVAEFKLAAHTFLKGNSRYSGQHTQGDVPFLPGLPNPAKLEQVIHGPETQALIGSLAQAWAYTISHQDGSFWEFLPKTDTCREVPVILNLSNGLQLKVRLDSITRLVKPRGKVTYQVVDFKTGVRRQGDAVEEEIIRREAQVMLMVTERLASYLAKNAQEGRKIRDYMKKGSFVFNANHANRAHLGRASFYYRRLDRENNAFIFEPIAMGDDESRAEFESWFAGFGAYVHNNRDLVKDHLKKAKQQDI